MKLAPVRVFSCIHPLCFPDWKISKATMRREYGSLAKQVVGSIGVFCLTETGKEQYIRRELPTLHFECNWKNTLFDKRMRTNIGRATAKTYNGDHHFQNVRCQ